MDTSTWLTCAEASDLIKCSENSIRTWARRNMLHPRRGKRVLPGAGTREVDLFNPHELASMARRRKLSSVPNDQGELAAQAFEMFERGLSQREIVIRLREPPGKVTQLHDLWMDMGGCDVVIGAAARAELECLVGPFVDVAELVARVTDLLGEHVAIRAEASVAEVSADGSVEVPPGSVEVSTSASEENQAR